MLFKHPAEVFRVVKAAKLGYVVDVVLGIGQKLFGLFNTYLGKIAVDGKPGFRLEDAAKLACVGVAVSYNIINGNIGILKVTVKIKYCEVADISVCRGHI